MTAHCSDCSPITTCFAGTWLFLDETLVKDKVTADDDETNISDNSSDPPHSNDSGIELLQPGATDFTANSEFSQDFKDDYEQDEQHLFDDESATDSEYDGSSDTELLRPVRTRTHFKFNRQFFQRYKSKCFQAFDIFRLARKVVQRITDCVGGFTACAMCLWTYDYTKCKPQNLQKRSSGLGRSLGRILLRSIKLILDRKVFLSVSLYGVMAYLAIISNEVISRGMVFSTSHLFHR